jgi:hypothetical protein
MAEIHAAAPTWPTTLEEAARTVVHHTDCDLPLDDCLICYNLAERADEERGSMDIAIGDLARLLPLVER